LVAAIASRSGFAVADCPTRLFLQKC